jgi:two-component system nitrogen regulation sensor histidine kinase NtrY
MNLMRRVRIWAGRIGLGRKIAIALAIPALASGVATYLALTGAPPFGPHPNAVLSLLNLDLVLLLALGAVVAKRLIEVWAERRRGLAGSRLQIRLVVLFSLIAVTPTIIVAVFSYLFFSFGIESWFSDKVRTAISESLAVAEAYLHEHQQAIPADVLAMANDLNRDAVKLALNPQHLEQVVSAQAALRGLTEAVVFDRAGHMLARSSLSFTLGFEPVPDDAMHLADAGDVAIMTNDSDDRVRALVRLNQFGDVYLFVGRFIEPRVLNHMEETQRAAAQYEQLEGQRSGFQITPSPLIFMMVAMLFLVAAVAIGIHFATQLAFPSSRLIRQPNRYAGDLAARVPEGTRTMSLLQLSRAFSTHDLSNRANSEELRRRRSSSSTSAAGYRDRVDRGIGRGDRARPMGVKLPNRSASLLRGRLPSRRSGKTSPSRTRYGGIARRGGTPRIGWRSPKYSWSPGTAPACWCALPPNNGRNISGFGVTFDDITELLSAQRKAAWADIARRIAHEIKNPLTPIQLAAERLRRRYLKEIKQDPETFTICTDTIIRHVGDIGRMIDEFSSFARMPAPVLKLANLVEIVHQAVFLQRTAHPEIAFAAIFPERPVMVRCDARLVGQALINIVKSAIESIQVRIAEHGASPNGRIRVVVSEEVGQAAVIIEDNGKGLPQQGRERLTEPYVTTRAKGTGLGLAIVKKIMEDHQGELVLEDAEPEGARVRLIFAASETRIPQRSDAADQPMQLSAVTHGA